MSPIALAPPTVSAAGVAQTAFAASIALLVWAIVELFRLGHTVGRSAPRGTLAHHMARFHAPLLTAILVANMTGDNLVGTVSVAQLAMWTAVLVRAGHDAVATGERA